MSGSALQSGASAHESMDMARAFRSEQERQGRYRGQAQQNFNQLVGQSGTTTASNDMAAGAENRKNLYGQLADTKMSFQPKLTTGSIRDAAAQQLAGEAQARLGSYSDWRQAQGQRELSSQRNLGQIENFAAGTGSVFPYRMYEAQHGWDWMAALGQALGSIGGNFGGGASNGYNFGGGGGSTPTSGGTTLGNYPGGANDNNASTYQQEAGVAPYTYQQMPQVQQNDANPYLAY